MIRRYVCMMLVVMFLTGSSLANAFVNELPIMSKEDIVKLSDEKLLDTYIDVVVELEASRSFHQTSGYAPKDYKAFKDLLRYRIMLILEMHKREMEPPRLEY